jgi:hypothetical protein
MEVEVGRCIDEFLISSSLAVAVYIQKGRDQVTAGVVLQRPGVWVRIFKAN